MLLACTWHYLAKSGWGCGYLVLDKVILRVSGSGLGVSTWQHSLGSARAHPAAGSTLPRVMWMG